MNEETQKLAEVAIATIRGTVGFLKREQQLKLRRRLLSLADYILRLGEERD